jgi:hypothetical protein
MLAALVALDASNGSTPSVADANQSQMSGAFQSGPDSREAWEGRARSQADSAAATGREQSRNVETAWLAKYRWLVPLDASLQSDLSGLRPRIYLWNH